LVWVNEQIPEIIMNWKFEIKSLKTNLIFWFLVIAITPLIVVVGAIYYQRVQSIKESEFNKLEAIREFKVREVNNWLDSRIGDIQTLSSDFEIRGLENIFEKQEHTQNDMNMLLNARNHLDRYKRYRQDFIEVFIISAATGKIAVSTNKLHEGDDRQEDLGFVEPMRRKNIYIKDIYHSSTDQILCMDFSTPIFCIDHDGEHIVGILAVRIDLEHSLYDLLLNRAGMGETGETLIVDNNVLALNELRWYENAPLKLKIDAEPAVLASQGKTGVVEAVDYRGERVLAAYTHIPRTGWGFVAKQDLKELNTPVRAMLGQFLLLLLLSALFVFILAFILARNIARPVIDMTGVAKKINDGDLSARNLIHRADELGYLANVFNDMADSIQSRMRIQQGDMDISETMVAAKSSAGFSRELVRKLAEITDSNLAVFYLYNEAANKFEHCDSIGVNADLLEPFDAGIHEGEIGKVLATHKISHIKNIPEDTKFKFKAVMGTAIPREIVTIPLVVDNKVMAVISLASLCEYSKESLEILDQSWIGLNTALSNLLANAETERLADELSSTNQELQAMNEELRSQAEELQAQSAELRSQAAELKEQTVELEERRSQVEEADRLKSGFLSNMSHELRTPLNSILALSELMIACEPEDTIEQYTEYLEIIQRNGRNLLNLINDILDLSKIESGRMDTVLTDFETRHVIDRALATVHPMAETKGLGVKVQIDDVPSMYSDEGKVHQVLLNILSNAVKFTERGDIEVVASSSDDLVSITISDTGIGISDDEQAHIFDEFRQVDGSTTRKFEGTGLGLAISQKLARLLGGRITVQSRLGEGSVFTLVLPVHSSTIKEKPARSLATGEEPFPLSPKAPLKGTILVIDDEQSVRNLLKSYLGEAGYKVVEALSGEDGLRLAREIRPSAITLDVLMPDMDGWEVIRQLKEDKETAEIPVIVVSVSDDRATGMALGAAGYIVKPVDKKVLLTEIDRLSASCHVRQILVVDDNPVDQKHLETILSEKLYTVETASGGNEALQMTKTNPPDVMVLDLMMPDMDGFTVLDRLREEQATRELPVIIVTAKDLTAEERSRLRNSVQKIITKSTMDRKRVLREIEKALAGLEQRRLIDGMKERPLILVVEDNEVAALQIRSALEDYGCAVNVAPGGAEALETIGRVVPDVVVLDLMMPEIDGFQVLEQIRSDPRTAAVPVLVLTAKEVTRKELDRLTYNNIQQLIQKGRMNRAQLVASVEKLLGKGSAPHHEQAKPVLPQEKPSKASKTILVVEDNPDNLFTITKILDKMRCKYLTASDGKQALKIARESHPGLILMDVQLPVLSGLDAAGQIKADKTLKDISIVALTAKAMKGDREKILASGCDDYISKPFSAKHVMKIVQKWIG
jgi:CheY-like chemotaxis protein/signal transduction histidine kinase/HAMP domain-containing protein